jgi:hypothetical protein
MDSDPALIAYGEMPAPAVAGPAAAPQHALLPAGPWFVRLNSGLLALGHNGMRPYIPAGNVIELRQDVPNPDFVRLNWNGFWVQALTDDVIAKADVCDKPDDIRRTRNRRCAHVLVSA